MHSAQSTQTVGDGKFRPRPYVGRHVPPVPSEPARALSVAERIGAMLQAAKAARYNAHCFMHRGDTAKASAAFFRAHEYLEVVRELRARL